MQIRQHNSRADQTFTLAHNHFSDMTNEDFRMLVATGLTPLNHSSVVTHRQPAELGVASTEHAVDWTTRNAVTPVKNQ